MEVDRDLTGYPLTDAARLLWGLPAAVCVCESPSGVMRVYNRRAVEIWGREPKLGDESELYTGAFRLYRADGTHLPAAESAMAKVIRDGGSREQDVIVERPNGTRIVVRHTVSAMHDARGRLIGAVDAFQDVTAHAQTSDAAAYLAAVVASADDAIITKTLEGIITSWNESASRLFGYDSDEATGKSIFLIIPAERHPEEEAILARIRKGQRIEHFETERVTKDGRRIPISLTVSPVKTATGEIIGASKVARDISERREYERLRDELLRRESTARLEAQAASRAKDEFLAMLAHELRNPVAGIVSAIAVLDEPDAGPEARGRARRVVRRQVKHLSELLDDLLDVARMTGGRVELEQVPVDVGHAMAMAIETNRYRFDSKRQRIDFTAPPEPLVALGDASRLQQVFGNLLHNAWKYTPSGGTVRVAVRREGDDVVTSVRDSGAGIPRDKLEAIFGLFTQANPTLARTEGGLGIGLALVKRLVELHNGTVQALSAGPGQGAEFIVHLPVVQEPEVRTDEPEVEQQVEPRKVLVVEDNADGRDMLVTVLRLAGHDVTGAATGSEGLRVALRERPDIVLLDLGLPDIEGIQVGRLLRERLGRQVRLVALTGYGQPQDRARSAEAGFDTHLVKPVDPSDLNRILGRLSSAAVGGPV
jgi:PAS domain S-box-containing protein